MWTKYSRDCNFEEVNINLEWKKGEGKIEIEKYNDGKLGVILPESVRNKFDEIFGDRSVDVYVGFLEDERKIIIHVEIPKESYAM